jgi:acyl-CoA synthetase (AMP-forming)/AMP-acid ligase II
VHSAAKAGTLSAQAQTLAREAAHRGPTVAALFRDAALRHADAIALEGRDRQLTFKSLNERVNKVANSLLGMGARHGQRIAILSENRIEYVEVQLACAKLGLIAACQNWRQPAPELSHCIRLVEPSFVFVSPRFEEALAETGRPATETHVFGDPYEALVNSGAAEEPRVTVTPEDGLLILYTSGTTGLPKGALISHRAMIARSMAMMADWCVTSADGSIAWSPLFHMASADPMFSSLCQGAKVKVVDGFDAEAIVAALATDAVGWFVLMPGMIGRAIEALRSAKAPIRRVVAAGCMANLVPPDQIAEISRLLGAPFLNSFGSTETGIAPASGSKIPPGVAPANFAKIQTSFCEVALLDDGDQEVPLGSVGEMCVRGPMLFSGYWNDPEATMRDFRGGWFHMGDDFVRHPDGALDFVDRRKYLIKSGGENIYPAEIERVLRSSGRVDEAVVVRQPDAHWGEIPVAFVVRRDLDLTSDDVLELLKHKIARYKLPKRVIFVADSDLLRNSTGKIQRNLLEQKLLLELRAETPQ